MKKIQFLFIAAFGAFFACTSGQHTGTAPALVQVSAFDTVLDGSDVSLYTLRNDSGMVVQVTNYGARVVSLWVPDAKGDFQDVVWGYESIHDYLDSPDRFCGPVVGRYGNRIGKGQFTLDGKSYQLTLNDGENHLHGGADGFWNKVWIARPFENEQGEQAVEMSYRSPDGEEGYPGNLSIAVTYTLQKNNALKIEYQAMTDAPTILNPTSHNYFNLHGNTASSTDSHVLTIHADRFTPTDAGLIPTGALDSVAGTPLDFRVAQPIGSRIDADFEPMKLARGYDHNWVLNKQGNEMSVAAEVYEPATGIVMKVETDQPGLQFYSGNFMDGTEIGKRGDRHNFRTGIALETQNFPDAPNHENFPSAVLRPGETYTQTCIYAFSVRK
nr:aldose epimerase family protein [uncultured Alistipes sp.]